MINLSKLLQWSSVAILMQVAESIMEFKLISHLQNMRHDVCDKDIMKNAIVFGKLKNESNFSLKITSLVPREQAPTKKIGTPKTTHVIILNN